MESQNIAETLYAQFNKDIAQIHHTELRRQMAMMIGTKPLEIRIPSNPEERINFQIQAMIHGGFHNHLGIPDRTYDAELRSTYKGSQRTAKNGFDVPVIVDPRIPIKRQIIGFDDDITEGGDDPNNIDDIVEIPSGSQPYVIWAQDGSRYSNLSLGQMKGELSRNERPLTINEVLALRRADMGLFFRNRPKYDNEGYDIGAGGSLTTMKNLPVVYHNYFTLQKYGEFQIDAFSPQAFNPRGGWPTTMKS